MSATAHGNLEGVPVGEIDEQAHVIDISALADQRRMPVYHAVPNVPRLLIPFLTRAQDAAMERLLQRVDLRKRYVLLHLPPRMLLSCD